MQKHLATLITVSAAGVFAAAASAGMVSGTVTADNHYALYTSTGGSFSYQGGNELGFDGSPGTYNWSMAESYQFTVGDFLYIAAWSDDAVAQGVLGEFHIDGLGTILSGDPRWEVYGTDINRGDGDLHPTALEIAGHVAFADENFLWETPYFGGPNGMQPWGAIADITTDAHWMWKNVAGDSDPLIGGSGSSEMLIFRTSTAVPAPASLAFLALIGVAGRRRRAC